MFRGSYLSCPEFYFWRGMWAAYDP